MVHNNQIGDFTIGRVIKDKTSGLVGHVTGFDTNPVNEIIICVTFANGLKTQIHPNNLRVL